MNALRRRWIPVGFSAAALLAGIAIGPHAAAGWFDRPASPAAARTAMVRGQLLLRGIQDRAVLKAMGKIPRERFIPEGRRDEAYEDHPVPIGYGQTISQPYIVAFMTEILQLAPGARVLEIGTGSGYQAAVLAEMGMDVYSVEIIPELARRAAATLRATGYGGVKVRRGDGYFGWPEHAPFDAIIVTAAASHVPPPLLEQLKPGGRLVIPLGSTLYYQSLTRITKTGGARPRVEQLLDVRFVPMTGRVQQGP